MFSKITSLIQESLKANRERNEASTDTQSQLGKFAAVALLIELIRADGSTDATEEQALIKTAIGSLGLPEENTSEWLDTSTQNADDATSLYEFTDIINTAFDKNQKFELIVNMWRIAYADGRLDKYEDNLIRKVAELIYVSHSDFMRAKHLMKL